MHDGAAIIENGRIKAAGCVLPLSNNLDLGKDMGTRHRACLGIAENSDAIAIVVSEETGIISMAKNGVLTDALLLYISQSGGAMQLQLVSKNRILAFHLITELRATNEI